jgi:uncharacterized RDD family membrane protein YckC
MGDPGAGGQANGRQVTDAEDTVELYGDMPNRLVAYAIDVIVVAAVAFGVVLFASRLTEPALHFDLAHDDPAQRVVVDRGLALIHALLATMVSAAYFAGAWRFLAGTPAQRLLGMRVVDASSEKRLSIARALIRWLLLLPPFGIVSLVVADVPGASGLVSALAALWGLALLLSTAVPRSKRGIHDLASGSVVLKRSRITTGS